MGWIIKLDEKGRIVIPSELRIRLGVKEDVAENKVVLARFEEHAIEDDRDESIQDFLSRS